MTMFEIAFYAIIFFLTIFNLLWLVGLSSKIGGFKKEIDIVHDDSVKRDLKTLDYINTYMKTAQKFMEKK